MENNFNQVMAIAEEQGDIDEDEEQSPELEAKVFVVGELCKLALSLDYADEIGRRKMFQLAREKP